jgi:REP element-mobilizing transposase RayT
MKRRTSGPRQQRLALAHGRGGRRPRAGRKPRDPRRPDIHHAIRPFHDAATPVHVTARVVDGLPKLRRPAVVRALEDAFRQRVAHPKARVVHYSIQANHLHLIVEADDRLRLSRGLQGLFVSLARTINRVLDRRGRVFAVRYHAHVLRTPTEARRAIRYVLRNSHKHTDLVGGRDPASSAQWFSNPAHPRPPPVAPPSTWLLRIGWARAPARA